MRCERCGHRMIEEQKENVLLGTTIIYQCTRCENQVRERQGDSLFHQLFHRDTGSGDDLKRAAPIDLH
ncbi:MAG: hypothetical protein ACMUHU_04095 [Thermoplasmatota archaeon]